MSRIRLRSAGRGRDYGPLRGLAESTLGVLYRRDWPARLWGAIPGTSTVAVRHYHLPILPRGRLRVGYLSDLHIGPTTPLPLLLDAARRLREARLDVLLLGGDYVYLDATLEKAAFLRDLVKSIPAALKLAVFGNHDLWTEHYLLEAALTDAGVHLLTNRSHRLGDVAFVGLDDPWTGAPDVNAALVGCADAAVRVGLVHSPDGFPLFRGRGVSVVMCGHTHGGQLALPGGRPLIVPGPSGKRWPHGRHDIDGTTLLVSRGLGGVEIPMRTFAAPDVLVVDLVAPPPS